MVSASKSAVSSENTAYPAVPAPQSSTGTGGRPIVWLSAFNLLFRGSSNILWLATMTLLLKSAGAQALPWLYTISNILLVAMFYFMKGALRERIGHPLLSTVTFLMIVISLLGSFLMEVNNSLFFLIMLILLVQTDETAGLSFAKAVSEHLTLKETKRWQPTIFAAGSVGLCISGLMLKLLLDIVSLKELLWANAVVLFVASFILSRLKRQGGLEGPSPEVETTDETSEEKPVFSPFSHPLVRLLIFSMAFKVCTKFPVDFLYADQISRYFASTRDLASFLGMFTASIDLLVIIIQTLVVGWVFSKFPIGRVLLLLPALMSVLCLVSVFHTSFILTVGLQFSFLFLARALNNPANYILLGAMPEKLRADCFRSIFIGKTASTLIAGSILIVTKNLLAPVYFFMALAVINVLFLVVTFGIDGAYFKTLKMTIRGTRKTGDLSMVESLKFVAVKDRIPEMKALLDHEDPAVRLRTIEEVSLLDSEQVQELLLPVLNHEEDPRCLTAMVNTLVDRTGHAFLDQIEEILTRDESPRLVANILESLGKIGWHERVEQMLSGFLSHLHHRIRGSAIISLLRIGRSKDTLMTALTQLAGMARSEAAIMRGTAAAVMGELALPMFVPALDEISLDGEEMASRNAMVALSKIRTPKAIAILEQHCQDPSGDRAELANRLYRQVSGENVKRISSLLSNLTAKERKYLLRTLKKTKAEGPLKLLGKILSIENEDARVRLTIIMQHSDPADQDELDRCLVKQPDGTTEPTILPIIQRYKTAGPTTVSKLWGKMVRAVAFMDRSKITSECKEALEHLWLEAIALEQGVAGSEKSLKFRRGLCNYLLAYSMPDPRGVMRALERGQSPDQFVRSIAHEYLESTFDRDILSLLIPLLYLAGKTGYRETAVEKKLFTLDVLSDEYLRTRFCGSETPDEEDQKVR